MLQSLTDPVVQQEQSQEMVDTTVVARGSADRVRYKTYEGESHVFSRADKNKSAMGEEATWFARWLSIEVRM